MILLVAVGILIGETMGQLFAGRPADLTLVGAALALLGIVPKLSKGDQ